MAFVAAGLAEIGSALYGNSATFGNSLIDASGEMAAAQLIVPKTGNIDRVGFRTNTVTSSQSLKVGLQTLSGGFPTGTEYGGSAGGTQASVASNTGYEVTLATPAAATLGDTIARVIEWTSTAGNLNIARHGAAINYPLVSEKTGGGPSWAHVATASPVGWIRYDDGIYYDVHWMPATAFSTVSYNSGTAGADEYGLRFVVNEPTTWHGCWVRWSLGTSADFDLVLYEGTTARSTRSHTAANISQTSVGVCYFGGQSYDLTAGTTYYIALKPTTANSVTLHYFDVLSNGVLDSFGRKEWYEAKRLDAGAWTETTTRRPMMGPLLSHFSDGAGSGGPVRRVGGVLAR